MRDLTPREMDVVRALATTGLKSRAIGEQLGLSKSTVSTHLSSVFKKTGARNRTDLIRLAYQKGWVSIEGDPGPPEMTDVTRLTERRKGMVVYVQGMGDLAQQVIRVDTEKFEAWPVAKFEGLQDLKAFLRAWNRDPGPE